MVTLFLAVAASLLSASSINASPVGSGSLLKRGSGKVCHAGSLRLTTGRYLVADPGTLRGAGATAVWRISLDMVVRLEQEPRDTAVLR